MILTRISLRQWALFLKRNGGLIKLSSMIFIGLGFTFVGYRLIRSWPELSDYRFRFHPGYFLLSLLLYSVGLMAAVLCWGLILRRLGEEVSFRRNIKLYCYSNLAKNVPGKVWYALGRVYLYEREGVAKTVTAMAIALELGLFVLAGSLLAGLMLPFSSVDLTGRDYAFIALLLCAGAILMHPPIFNRFANFIVKRQKEDVDPIAVGFGDIVIWLLLNSAVLVIAGVALFCVMNAFYPTAAENLLTLIGAWALSAAAGNLIFWMPSGLGVNEGMLALVISSFAPFPIAVAAAIIWRAWGFFCEACWVLIATRL